SIFSYFFFYFLSSFFFLICFHFFFFFFNDTATTEIYTLSLHDALPIFARGDQRQLQVGTQRPGSHAHLLDDADLREPVFHEVSSAEIESVEARNLVEPLVEVVKACDRPGLVRFVRTETAEADGVLDARFLDRG